MPQHSNFVLKMTYPSPSHKTWTAKRALRVLSSIVCLVGIGICTRLYILEPGQGTFFFVAPPAIAAFCWNAADILCLNTLEGRRGLHPAACIALDLCFWLGFIVFGTFSGLLSSWGGYAEIEYTQVESNLTIAATIICALIVLIHFPLFVIACIENNVRRHREGTRIHTTGVARASLEPERELESFSFDHKDRPSVPAPAHV
ncbi:hypothetical protein PT974_08660 [Cladobotryum mycophilum]|uniref:MARVEL domain-containing protein n=1 Tax=Cladobotryum mycophilum TaxID=491253 RepID=A0ABR0SEW7_9HYPO